MKLSSIERSMRFCADTTPSPNSQESSAGLESNSQRTESVCIEARPDPISIAGMRLRPQVGVEFALQSATKKSGQKL